MYRLLLSTLISSCFTGLAFAQAPVIALNAGIHVLQAELAATQDARIQGLMNRRHLDPNAGMLFVFPQKGIPCMWMRNTLIPLSVAFIDESGRVLNVENMAPQTTTNHCASAPARYALETNLGWFRQHGLGPGTLIQGLNKAPAPQ
ncbi:MAG: DUF192 domain-containing protein [Proteobacteria bacterium]|nr:DUF192 domain-containing protein [Pseudomonadota bacterium]HQR02838.1 DUF192 domain-containing protein [Rhodocyclaceae bacterium]